MFANDNLLLSPEHREKLSPIRDRVSKHELKSNQALGEQNAEELKELLHEWLITWNELTDDVLPAVKRVAEKEATRATEILARVLAASAARMTSKEKTAGAISKQTGAISKQTGATPSCSTTSSVSKKTVKDAKKKQISATADLAAVNKMTNIGDISPADGRKIGNAIAEITGEFEKLSNLVYRLSEK